MLNRVLSNAACLALLSAGLVFATVASAGQSKIDPADRNTILQIKRDVMRDKSLSTDAQHIAISAEGGTVTLKGQVHSDAEKSTLLAHAQKHAGQSHVVDQLTVENR
jgi:osmotically-inducible protein OsmY